MNPDLYKNHYKVIAPLIMGSGVGDGLTTACVMAQAAAIDALRKGKSLESPTDEMECACPVLRRIAIRLNDTGWWKDDMERTEALRPLIPLLLDSKGSKALTSCRVFFMTDKAVRDLTPMRLEWIAANTKDKKVKKETAAGAKLLRGLAPITDKDAAGAAREACEKLKASTSASADAYASDAYASAYASASTSTSASAYAYAYAYADAQLVKYRDALLSAFKECAALK